MTEHYKIFTVKEISVTDQWDQWDLTTSVLVDDFPDQQFHDLDQAALFLKGHGDLKTEYTILPIFKLGT